MSCAWSSGEHIKSGASADAEDAEVDRVSSSEAKKSAGCAGSAPSIRVLPA